jgi:S1-C subfamily serine protease
VTGFRVKDQIGIVTALHGVVGCDDIWAENTSGQYLQLKTLRITAVDIDRDVAVLYSEDLAKLPASGLELSPDPLRAVRVEGMPQGNKGLGGKVELNDPPLGPLDPVLGDKASGQLGPRNSPSLNKEILRLKGLEPGDSGGPILDGENRVAAIADGGLKGGASRVCWAIPYRDIHWVSLVNLSDRDRRRYKDLSDDPADDLFSYEDVETELVHHHQILRSTESR